MHFVREEKPACCHSYLLNKANSLPRLMSIEESTPFFSIAQCLCWLHILLQTSHPTAGGLKIMQTHFFSGHCGLVRLACAAALIGPLTWHPGSLQGGSEACAVRSGCFTNSSEFWSNLILQKRKEAQSGGRACRSGT